jgi:DNA-binding HxlR family transcriptional regulator
MTTTLGLDASCSIARSLAVVGEKWSLLIVREAATGSTRFSQFQSALGIARNVLAERLATLVEFGILARRPYRSDGERERDEYVLTDAGRELRHVLGSLSQWGARNRPNDNDRSNIFTDSVSGEVLSLRFVAPDGRVVDDDDVNVQINHGTVGRG